MLKIQFTTSGAAFKNPYTGKDDTVCEEYECARILKRITKEIEFYGARSGAIMDINGNKIGEWSL